MFVVYTAHSFLNSEGCVLKQSLPLLNKTTLFLNYLEFSWIFYRNIYFCEQCQEGKKLAVEGHLCNENKPLIEST